VNVGWLLVVGVIALAALLIVVDDLAFPEALLVSTSIAQLWLLYSILRKLDSENPPPGS